MNTERCVKCGTELIMFPDVLGYVKPIVSKCLGCGTRVDKGSLWCKIKNFVKWERA